MRKQNKPIPAKSFIINCEVYPFDILFHFGTKESLIAKLKKLDFASVKEVEGWTFRSGKTAIDERNRTFVWLPNAPKSPVEYGTLAHEIFHAVVMILDKVGITISDYSDEAFAYLIGYVTTKVYDKLKITNGSRRAA